MLVQQDALTTEIRRRLKILQTIGDDPRKQAVVMACCAKDMLLWINDYVWTYDPRRKPSNIPFVLFPKQEEYLLWRLRIRESKQNGLCEKSRDMGVTWLNVVHQTHCWLFETGFKGSFGSRKEELVDRIGDLDSIFQKIRFLLENLPKWMLPNGFKWELHDNFRKIINPANGSTLTGEAGSNIGRGGRSSFYDLDEAAFIERPEMVDAALSNNTEVVFYTSSANGVGNPFYQKRFSYPDECIFTFHWRDDPRKDEEWYAAIKRKYDPVIIASEVDIDYTASVEGIYIPGEWVRTAIDLSLPAFGTESAGLDVATSGRNKSVLIHRKGPRVLHLNDWQGLDGTQTTYKTKEILTNRRCPHLNFDADGVGEAVTGPLANMPDLPFTFTAVRGASSPSETYWEVEEKTSKQKFHNKRAELWGLVRERFRKTYDRVVNGIDYPEEELISIPNYPALIAQISQPKRKWTAAGKILIESKDDMKKRGVDSPDYADALVLAFFEEENSADWLSVYRID